MKTTENGHWRSWWCVWHDIRHTHTLTQDCFDVPVLKFYMQLFVIYILLDLRLSFLYFVYINWETTILNKTIISKQCNILLGIAGSWHSCGCCWTNNLADPSCASSLALAHSDAIVPSTGNHTLNMIWNWELGLTKRLMHPPGLRITKILFILLSYKCCAWKMMIYDMLWEWGDLLCLKQCLGG